jgi:energy-converting hydrogenase A subunit M
MSLPTLSEKDLSPYFSKADIIRQTAEQLNKDLAQVGEEVSFTGNTATAYAELFSQVEPLIRKMLSSRQETLMQLLYRIDVNEQHMAGAIQSGGEIAGKITQLILLRELQKVVIRNFYK